MNFKNYVDGLIGPLRLVEVTDDEGRRVSDALEAVCRLLKGSSRTYIVGNGGSAAIASHVAIDLSKNANIPAMAFNDLAALTCLSNDYGYEYVFSKQVELQMANGDVLIAISASGQSKNIINAAYAARRRFMPVITFSGFRDGNQLRTMGKINFYVPNDQYGYVELSHMILLHAIIDMLVQEKEMLQAAE